MYKNKISEITWKCMSMGQGKQTKPKWALPEVAWGVLTAKIKKHNKKGIWAQIYAAHVNRKTKAPSINCVGCEQSRNMGLKQGKPRKGLVNPEDSLSKRWQVSRAGDTCHHYSHASLGPLKTKKKGKRRVTFQKPFSLFNFPTLRNALQ